jgi:four helix bundle protein
MAAIVAAAKRYQDLVCWQLADELEQLVCELTAIGLVSRDLKFRDQIRDSSASATRNMAEGFGRYLPADFAKFLTIARASLMETHNSAGTGFKRGYFTAENTDKMQRLAARSGKAATRLIQYLRSCSPRSPRGSRTPRTS